MRIGMYGVLCLLVACAGAGGSRAQSTGHHHAFHDDHYSTWQRPDVGGSCCNARQVDGEQEIGDCEPTTAEYRGGRWFAWLREQARWVEVPDELILREINSSPENAHLCWAFGRVLCFLPPYSGG